MNYSQVTVDILQNPKYAGAIDSVSWLTNWIDSGFGMAITLVAFLIILVAMFKNVLAAAYCAYPKFWDRVDAAHKEVESIGWIQQFKDTFMTKDINSGSFSNAIMRLLPNIKTLTDFEGDTVRPKTYFIRAIPQMLLCVIIGAFIYNGYYRDTAAKVVDFGSEMVSRVLLEVDPIAVFDQFTGSAGRPVFASDGSELPQQKLVNRIATEVYGAIIGEYNDIENINDKRAIANTIEELVNSWVAGLEAIDSTYTDGKSWKSILQVSLVNGAVSTDHINGVSANNGNTMQYANQFAVSTLNLPSTINVGEDMYVRIRLNFEKQAVSNGKHAVDDLTLHLASTSLETQCQARSNLLLSATAGSITGTSTSGNGAITVTVTEDTEKNRNLKVTISKGSQSGTYELAGSGLKVVDSKNGSTHFIKYISFDGAGVLSSEKENRTDITWNTTDLGVVVSSEAPAPSASTSKDGAEVE